MMFLFCLIAAGLLSIPIFVLKYRSKGPRNSKNVCIVVLGDIGRSPRMQYHAMSFAKEQFTVDFIGYPGSPPLKELTSNSLVNFYYLSPPPNLENSLPRLLNYIIKVLWQIVTLLTILLRKPMSSYLILQNPPAIPTTPICWFYCKLVQAHFTIDWHNYAHSLMSLSLGKNHALVRFARFMEMYFGYRAQNNFCVTKAMKEDLEKVWGIKAQVLYDRPADKFHPISLYDKHEFLLKLSKQYDVFKGDREGATAITEIVSNKVHLRSDRPGFIVSSTSWTEDEDFSILLNALQDYEAAFEDNTVNLPDLICAITGKGPLKDFYLSIIKLKSWKHVKVITPWLENEDYPKMLASADLGICLHTSSSGLDLPMKVIDMFGCGLPVCAYYFQCLPELVKHNENSLIFSNEKELASQLRSWFENFPVNSIQQERLEKFQQELQKFQENRWHGNWLLNALPCFQPK